MEVELKTQEKERNILEFTGNWFFDLGILGFVNLMEEVYDWNLEELRRKIDEDKETIFYYYFPFAYLFYHSKAIEFNMDLRNIIRKKKLPNKDDLIKRLKENFSTEKKDFINSLEKNLKIIRDDSQSLFKNSKDLIKSMIKNFKIHAGGSGRNFYLYNPPRDLFNSFTYLHYLIKEDFGSLESIKNVKKKEKLSYEIKPDSSINPFIFSLSIKNFSYTDLPDVEILKKALTLSIPVYIPFLSIFSHGFLNILNRNICFYIPNLDITYSVNKRIKLKKELIGKGDTIFKITFSSIIEELIERKSEFSLDNMYIIEYGGVGNDQKIKNVEYIGISKLKAKILLNENIRDSINKTVSLKVGKETKNVWILEEFIKNKPLLPIILNHMRNFLNKKVKLAHVPSLFHALSIDLILKELEKENKRTVNIFDDGFFTTYPEVIKRIKNNKRIMNSLKSQVSQIFANLKNEEKERLAQILTSMVIKGNRTNFVNFLLKWILKQEIKEKNNLFNLMIEYILNNENWKHFALSIILGLISGGEEKND